MVQVIMDPDSITCTSCGKRFPDNTNLRILKISKDGRNSSCTGSLCRVCRINLIKELANDLAKEG